jgi:hypothetical protein
VNTDKLRDKLIAKAITLLDTCTQEEAVDVFKAVSSFYIGATKGGPKGDKPDNAGFGAVIERLNGKQKDMAQ